MLQYAGQRTRNIEVGFVALFNRGFKHFFYILAY